MLVLRCACGHGFAQARAGCAGLVDQRGVRSNQAGELLHRVGVLAGHLASGAIGLAAPVAERTRRHGYHQAAQCHGRAAHSPGPQAA